MALWQLQMTWQPHLKKRKNVPPLGLKNLGNTCYLNSVLQCLTYTPPLAYFCLKLQHTSLCDLAAERDKKSECPFCLLERRICRSLNIDLDQDHPSKIISGLRIFADHFRPGRQEDAHEFLRYVIDACHTTCLRLKKLQQRRRKAVCNGGGGGEGLGGETVVKEIFGGALQSQVKCLVCGSESNKVDEIMDISLDILNSSSLKEAFQKFFQPEILDGSNKYKCDNCKKLVSARKQMSILQAPNVLVIQLKRFEGIFGGKIDKKIAFEEVLVLSSFMCKASKDPHSEYNLFATIVHSGFSLDSGHYYAYIKDAMGRWYCCNDSFVSLSTLQDVFSEKVYILFFSRTQQRPVSVSKILATNGTKSYDCNGNNTLKILKASNVVKSTGSLQYVDHHMQKDNSTKSKADKVPSPQSGLTSSGDSGNRKFPGTLNGIVNQKKESNGNNGLVNAPVRPVKSEKKMPSIEHTNGFSQSKLVDTVDGRRHSSPLVKTNGNIQRSSAGSPASASENNDTSNRGVKDRLPSFQKMQNGSFKSPASAGENNDTSNRGIKDSLPSFQEVQNGSFKCHPDNSSRKRKGEDIESCVLLRKDAQSQARCEEFKEGLEKKAALFLRSCGFYDEVASFMSSSKKSRAQEVGNDALNNNELKRLLIADAKPFFKSRIPEPLKANLIACLQSFSRGEQVLGQGAS